MSIFGQNPADITGALFKAKNLADVPDKAAARTALDVPSKAEVQYNSVPVGMILPFWGSVAPVGYVPCSGQTVTSASFPELVTFLGGTTSAVVPDLRGEFLRGWDNGRGVDAGRTIFSFQDSQNLRHTHPVVVTSSAVGDDPQFVLGSKVAAPTFTQTLYNDTGAVDNFITTPKDWSGSGGVESRPRNVSVLYCIKAYSSVTNFTTGLNLAGLVNDYSTLAAGVVRYTDFTGTNQIAAVNGYQKLPGGTIIQWGWTNVTDDQVIAVTLPVAFPNNFYSATATPQSVTATTGSGTFGASAHRTSLSVITVGMNIGTGSGTTAVGVCWMAVGN